MTLTPKQHRLRHHCCGVRCCGAAADAQQTHHAGRSLRLPLEGERTSGDTNNTAAQAATSLLRRGRSRTAADAQHTHHESLAAADTGGRAHERWHNQRSSTGCDNIAAACGAVEQQPTHNTRITLVARCDCHWKASARAETRTTRQHGLRHHYCDVRRCGTAADAHRTYIPIARCRCHWKASARVMTLTTQPHRLRHHSCGVRRCETAADAQHTHHESLAAATTGG
jgi:hypothetical protein